MAHKSFSAPIIDLLIIIAIETIEGVGKTRLMFITKQFYSISSGKKCKTNFGCDQGSSF